jgi:uncharacterized protein
VANVDQQLRLAIIGATGQVGRKILDETLARGYPVTAIVRDVSRLPAHAAITPVSAATQDPDRLASALTGHDVAIVSVRWNENDVDQVLDAVRRAGVGRVIIVIGAGSLLMPDGRLYYEHNLDRGIDPPTSKAALAAYRRIVELTDLDWTAASPAARIEPGARTARFSIGADALLVDADGESRISQEDFAVAILDEVEQGNHVRRRFTVAYQ